MAVYNQANYTEACAAAMQLYVSFQDIADTRFLSINSPRAEILYREIVCSDDALDLNCSFRGDMRRCGVLKNYYRTPVYRMNQHTRLRSTSARCSSS